MISTQTSASRLNEANALQGSSNLRYFPFGTSKPLSESKFYDTDEHRIAQRIFRHLTNDVKTFQPEIAVPPAWLQRQLIRSHICGNMKGDWRQAMLNTLIFINESASKELERCGTEFIDFDAHGDLFPNREGYTLRELRVFIRACLQSPFLQSAQSLGTN